MKGFTHTLECWWEGLLTGLTKAGLSWMVSLTSWQSTMGPTTSMAGLLDFPGYVKSAAISHGQRAIVYVAGYSVLHVCCKVYILYCFE